MHGRKFKLDKYFVKELLKENGLTQLQVDRYMGYSNSVLAQRLSKGVAWHWDEIEKLASILNVEPHSLLQINEKSEKYYNIVISKLNCYDNNRLYDLAYKALTELKSRKDLKLD